jgi:hypothetical protein
MTGDPSPLVCQLATALNDGVEGADWATDVVRVEMVLTGLKNAGYVIVTAPLGECICPKCGIRHGTTRDPDDLVPF